MNRLRKIMAKHCGSCFCANGYPSHPAWQKQVGDLTVLVPRLGERLMGLGLDGLLSSNSFLLRTGRSRNVSEVNLPSLFHGAPSVCIPMRLCRQHAWLLTQAPLHVCWSAFSFPLYYKHLNYTSPHFNRNPRGDDLWLPQSH